jgi:hypothetical protein
MGTPNPSAQRAGDTILNSCQMAKLREQIHDSILIKTEHNSFNPQSRHYGLFIVDDVVCSDLSSAKPDNIFWKYLKKYCSDE